MSRNHQSIFEHDNSGHGGGGGHGHGSGHGHGPGRPDVDALQQGQLLFRLTGESDFLDADVFYVTKLTTLNSSGVTGEVIIGYDLDTDTITVAISASGLEANQVHIQHIHGFVDGTNSTTPTIAQDVDGDGFVEVGEGAATYGPVLLNLATNHDNDAGGDNGHNHEGGLIGFPTAPNGEIWFVESFQLPSGLLPAGPTLDLREIVIHGLSAPAVGAGTAGEVNGIAGYKVALPAASGELIEIESAQDLRRFINRTDFDDDARDNVDGPFDLPSLGFDSSGPGSGDFFI